MNKKSIKKEKSYFESLLSVKRVTKVVEGGRIFSFSAFIVVGDKEGLAGYAKGKAKEVSNAKNKAIQKAKKNLVRIPIYQGRTIHHDVKAKVGSTKIMLRRAKAGTGIIAGPNVRSVLQNIGLKDIVAKSHGSSNVYTSAMAVFKALSKINTPKLISQKRQKKLEEISVVQNK